MLVVTRGGGSLEDLWAFNERPVADAIWNTSVPVVSGVGHESDVTLADFVADHRAHTPTDAAQTVLPDRAAWAGELERLGNYLVQAMDGELERRAERLGEIAQRRVVRDASWILGDRERWLDEAFGRLRRSARHRLDAAATDLERALARLERQSPGRRLDEWSQRLVRAGEAIERAAERTLERSAARVALAARTLEATSPLAVLGRGYSLTRRRGSPEPLTSHAGLAPGDELESRLADGTVVSEVTEVRPDAADERRDADAADESKDHA